LDEVVTTYEIPDEPEGVFDVWGPTRDGEGWVHYRKGVGPNAMWRIIGETKMPRSNPLYWFQVLQRGPLTDEDPDPSLETLGQRVVVAAIEWQAGQGMSLAAVTRLRRAVNAYVAKAEQ
jgi:hypothetical protein